MNDNVEVVLDAEIESKSYAKKLRR